MSETGKDDTITPAITAAAVIAGLALTVLVVIVAVLIYPRIRGKVKKLAV